MVCRIEQHPFCIENSIDQGELSGLMHVMTEYWGVVGRSGRDVGIYVMLPTMTGMYDITDINKSVQGSLASMKATKRVRFE